MIGLPSGTRVWLAAGVTDLGYGAFPLPADPDLGPYAAAGYEPAQFDGFVLWWAAGTPCAATTGQ